MLSAGCSRGGGGDRLTVYSGRLPELVEPLLEDFSEQTGIGIDVRYGDSADLALLVDEEGDKSPADVFISQSPGAMGYLDGQDRLTKLPRSVLDRVEARFRAPDGEWVGLSARARVLVYNPDLVPAVDLPASVFDLTKSRYRDQVAVAPTNASFQDFVSAMRELSGDARTEEWLAGMKANGARSYANNLAIVDAVGRGEIPMGLVNDYYLFERRNEDPDLPARNYFFPNRDLGTIILATSAGVLDTNDRGSEAHKLVDFLLSKRAQEFFAERTFEYPLVAGVEPVAGKPPLASIEAPRLELGSLGGELARTRQMIADSGLEQS
ncbi:MAG: iron ABC transporter substrate-binding protein [Acidimicrobiia bacterium]